MAGYRPAYTIDEDMTILKMIIDTKSYYKISGTLFWKDVSNSGYIDRTWQSLKERFEKQILPHLDHAKYTISDIEKKNIKLAAFQLTYNYDDDEEGSGEFEDTSSSSSSCEDN